MPGSLAYGRPEVVEQPSRGGDQDVDTAAEGVFLGSHPDTAIDCGGGDGGVHRHGVAVFEDLRRQFPGRCQDECPGGPPGLVDQVMQDRQEEGRGLAAAGHGTGEDVPARQCARNCLSLNGGRTGETELLESFEQGGVELER